MMALAKEGEEISKNTTSALSPDGVVKKSSKQKIKHIVDKMLFNYRNIGMSAVPVGIVLISSWLHEPRLWHLLNSFYLLGFIHLMFPEAVILHTMRDPLDTLFRYI
jgi:hypothetical protein